VGPALRRGQGHLQACHSCFEEWTGSWQSIMAAQDFRHAAQEENGKVGDFIRQLERLFKLVYGHDSISAETLSTLLYRQLQQGLKHRIMEAPAVSGATDYQALCLAAKGEEKRLAALRKRRQYQPEHKSSQTGGARLGSRRENQPPRVDS